MLDYSKYKYEQAQKLKAARKHQQQITIREIKFRPKIAQHDYDTKKGHVERFLRHKDKVKVTIMFRGREVTHPERGVAILDRLAEELAEFAVVEQRPLQDGRNMTMMLGPSKAVLAGQFDKLTNGAVPADLASQTARRPRLAPTPRARRCRATLNQRRRANRPAAVVETPAPAVAPELAAASAPDAAEAAAPEVAVASAPQPAEAPSANAGEPESAPAPESAAEAEAPAAVPVATAKVAAPASPPADQGRQAGDGSQAGQGGEAGEGARKGAQGGQAAAAAEPVETPE